MITKSDAIVRLGDTDAAGVLYFAAAFRIAHAAIEDAFEHAGFPVIGMLKKESFIFPIVHAEADFHSPLTVGDKLTLQVTLRKKSRSTLEACCEMFLGNLLTVTVTTIHVRVEKRGGKAVAIPDSMLKSVKRP